MHVPTWRTGARPAPPPPPPPPPRVCVLQAIPQVATAPVLVLVGAMMMGESTHIDWSSMLTAVPAFLTIVIQPFTFSIANGIYAGLAMTVLLWLLTGTFLQDFSAAKAAFYESGGSLAAAAGADLETPLLNGAQHYGAEEQAQIAAQLAGVADSPPALRRGSQQSCYFHNNELAQQQQQQQQQRQQQQAIPIGDARGGPRRSSYSITGPGGSMAGSIAGSLRGHSGAARGTPYERGSFTMFINTFGSHTVSPGGVLGSTAHMQPGSEEPGH
jgi:AGZA family xanthine/uracil permease-like MFS transporter